MHRVEIKYFLDIIGLGIVTLTLSLINSIVGAVLGALGYIHY